ncbi:MAG: hypothetical protein FJW34_00180 [Acidobacteria bacterium]|nr:hypothetical protein [Acidobacteriota bacterium]
MRHTRRSWFGLIAGALFGRKAAAHVGLDASLPVARYANTVTPGADLTLEALQAACERIVGLPQLPILLLANPGGPRLWELYPGAVVPIDEPFSTERWYALDLCHSVYVPAGDVFTVYPPTNPPTDRS